MEFQIPDFYPAAAELFVAGMALVVLLIVSFVRRGATVAYWLTQATVVGMALVALLSGRDVGFTFGQMYIDDPLGDFLKLWVALSVLTSLLYGRRYLIDRGLESAEYYLIVMFSMLGSMILISAGSLLTVYLGLEMLSLSSYALVAINRDSTQSTEAGMKYFVLGALASGLLLYGISMVYGATQTLNIIDVARALFEQQANRPVLMFGMVFVVAGVGFKMGAVPFHMWLPDVYQGAPTAVTLLIASAPKLAAFAMTFRLLAVGFWDFAQQWQMMLILLAIGSLVIGNLGAIAQTNIKRMLAFSTIGHMGFILLGLASGVVGGERYLADNAYSAALFYVVTYVLTTLASFGMILLMSRAGFEADQISDFKGLNKRNSWWAAMMSMVMFSMAGIPFFVGFFSKFLVLQFVVATDHVWLAVLAVMMSLIGAFYYLRIVKLMYFDEPIDESPIVAGVGVRVVLSANVLAVAAFGLFPNLLMYFCSLVIHGSF
ncbi:NADH-quinone oxidoreductase subunit NuoN [Uliginosibacterium sp. H3]|uniref:NADH-quinone oxidoreductase subunit N n=1 Tax=Uliginosibacterium silvisoli TaxID=3114758 RepID=A0ABU6K595_9RHOO|nr:NADH-quinone oxidoreductase subunit NuoN [Uliginosibacterium sp. H3]